MLIPHAHQVTMLDEARAAFREHNAVLMQSPTGSGKTVIGTLVVQGSYNKKRRTMFTVHRDFLVDQTSKQFQKIGMPHGIIAAGYSGDMNARCQIASIDTLKNRLDRVPRPDLLVVDECHHALAAGWLKVIEGYIKAGTKVMGLSATPWRMSGQGLGHIFDHMVKGPTVRWLIDNGFLVDYVAYAPVTPDLAGVKTSGGDYTKGQAAKAMDKPKITGDAIQHYLQLARGKRAVAFCASVEHSQHVANAFNDAGIPAAHLDADTDKSIRRNTIKAFARGEILVLTSVDIFGEGFDLPEIDVAILLRPTKSLALHLQQIGRALRTVYADGFDLSTTEGRRLAIAASLKPRALILDHAGNLMRLGLPDFEFDWTLADLEKKKKAGAAINVRQCIQCFGVFSPAPVCPYCGCVQPIVSRVIEQVDGQLQELTKAMQKKMAWDKRREVLKADSLEDLRAIAEQRGYSPRWAEMVHGAKKRKADARAQAQAEAYLR